MSWSTVGKAALFAAALSASACSDEPGAMSPESSSEAMTTQQQDLASGNKVLILASTVNGGLDSREARAVKAYSPTARIDVVTPEQWKVMTAQEFMAYRTLIIGDAACQSGTAAFQAAIDSRRNWGAIVDGDVAIIASNPSSNGTEQVVENGISYVLNSMQKRTGMYIALGCAYQDAPADTAVELLEPFGTFKVQGVAGCAPTGHIFAMYNEIMSSGLDDSLLAGADNCAARSVFTTYPTHSFTFAGIAMRPSGPELPGQQVYSDFMYEPEMDTPFAGTPYILVRGAMNLAAGCGIWQRAPDEECDLGDGLNGQPAFADQDPRETCSYSCHSNWCGDGVVDKDFGEECDLGQDNGRTLDSSGAIGQCTAFCKVPNLLPPAGQPPVALCKNVSAFAEFTCGASANVNNGSYDPDSDLVGCTQSPAGPYNIGETAVTLTCTDQGGRSSSCTGIVTVADTAPPTIALQGEANQSVECTTGGLYTDPGATANDQCDGALPASSITRTGSVTMGALGTYPLSYSAKDRSGNSSDKVYRTVSVTDTLAPVITRNGTDVTFECGTPYTDDGATAYDQCEGDVTGRIVRSGTVNSGTVGNYILRYNVKDSGNRVAAEVARTVFVRDHTKPTVTLVGATGQTAECGAAYTDPGATATDACVGPLPAMINSSTVNTGVPGSYSLNYKATDASGNIALSGNRTVTVGDTKAPVLTLLGTATATLECATAFTDPGATASDQCYGNLSSSIVKTGTVNNMALGSYTLSYNVKDPKNNAAAELTRTVTVRDTVAPAISVTGALNVAVECGSSYTDSGATASDSCAGTVPAVAQGSTNVNAPGVYTFGYQATDPSGNVTVSSAKRTVSVSDTLPPTLALNGSASMGLECGSPFADPGATANDQCAGSLPVTVSGSVNSMTLGSYALSYSATDGAGHSVSASRTVAVSDTVAPTLTVNGPVDVSYACGGSYVDPGATATDTCAGDLTASIQAIQTGSTTQPGTFTVTYSVKDPSGNRTVSPVVRTVHVNDDAPPVLSLLGPAIQSLECGSEYNDLGATANDACFGDVTSRITKSGLVNSGATGSYTVVYNVADPAGQSAAPVSRRVNVSDTLAPSLTVLGEFHQQVECGSTYVDPGATALDVCAGNLTATVLPVGSVNPRVPGNYSLGYKVTDPSGNSAETAQDARKVTVVDTLAPTVSLVGPATQTLECGSSYVDPGATANDACAGDLSASIVKTGSVNSAVLGSYSLGYSVNDGSGHSASASRSVTVRDTLAPQLQLLTGPSTIQCNGAPYIDPGATASDSCAGNVTSRITKTSNLDQTRAGQYAVTYSVTDTAGNTSTAVRQLTVAGPCANTCVDVHLNDYNLFLEGSYSGGHDVVGKVAAGGNISMENFAVGSGLPASNISKVLVAGGNLTLNQGTVWGEAFYGGTLSTNQSVTFPRAPVAKGTPIDFAARFADLRAVSAKLAALPANGTYKRESWGGVMLTGTNTNVNVFDVPASAFTGHVLLSITAPSGSFVVVNIRGASATFQNAGHSFSGVDQHNILYNFVDTTAITASGYGFWGTLLAPYANVNFSNGSWDGGIYAKSFTGSAEGHINTLNDRTICP